MCTTVLNAWRNYGNLNPGSRLSAKVQASRFPWADVWPKRRAATEEREVVMDKFLISRRSLMVLTAGLVSVMGLAIVAEAVASAGHG